MAIGWMTVLQSVPWGDVVNNAPKVAAGARKLWRTVAKKPLVATAPKANGTPPLVQSPEAQAITALKTRVLELESDTVDLKEQMVESSGLITALAEQNNQLIIRLETMRLRMMWMAGALAVISAAVVADLGITLGRV